MVIQIIFFLSIILGILFGCHYFLYFSIVKFFAITGKQAKVTLFVIAILLSFTFIEASFLARWKDNFLTRAYYIAAAGWIGILANLILACILIWLILGVGKLAGINLNVKNIAIALFSLALICSAYGFWNARNPRIKNIEVEIKNLPANWRNKKIVHIADTHLGHINREKFLKKVVDKINEVNSEAVFITGDFFDGMDGDLTELISPIDDIKTNKGVFFVTGNHETYLGLEEVFSVLKKTKVNILNDEIINLEGIQVIGASYPDRGEKKDVKKVLEENNFDKNIPSILLYHSPTNIDEIKNLGINLMLSGHTHLGQIFPFRYITHLIYKGYDYGLYQEGDFSLYTTCGAGTWGPPMRTGHTPEIVAIELK